MESRATFLVMNGLYLAIVAAMVYAAYGYGGEASIVSLVIGIPTLVLLVVAIASAWRKANGHAAPVDREELVTVSWSRAAIIVVWLVALFLAIFFAGFYPAIFLFTFAFLRIQGRTSWATALITAGLLFAGLYFSFDYVMQQQLFQGILFKSPVPVL